MWAARHYADALLTPVRADPDQAPPRRKLTTTQTAAIGNSAAVASGSLIHSLSSENACLQCENSREFEPIFGRIVAAQQQQESELTYVEAPMHENPLITAFRTEAIVDRQIDELIGIIKGVTADGMVSEGEVRFLLAWMDANRKAANVWPAKAIYPRLAAAVAGGKMSLEAETELLGLLINAAGGNTAPQSGIGSDSTKLPLSDPSHKVTFAGKSFCFTGTFASGSRNWCHEQIERLGGATTTGITKKLHYLVIGEIGNENWLHSTHGRKIEKAVEYNSSGSSIVILSEEHWYSNIQ